VPVTWAAGFAWPLAPTGETSCSQEGPPLAVELDSPSPFGRAYSVEQSAEPSSPAAVLRAGGAYGPGHTLRTPRKHFRASRPPASALGPTVMVVATFWSSEIMRGLAGLFALVGSLSSLFSTGRG